MWKEIAGGIGPRIRQHNYSNVDLIMPMQWALPLHAYPPYPIFLRAKVAKGKGKGIIE